MPKFKIPRKATAGPLLSPSSLPIPGGPGPSSPGPKKTPKPAKDASDLSRAAIVKALKGKCVKVKAGELKGTYYGPQGDYNIGVVVPDDKTLPVMKPGEFERHSGHITTAKWKSVIKAVMEDGSTCEIDRWLATHFPDIASASAKKWVAAHGLVSGKKNVQKKKTVDVAPHPVKKAPKIAAAASSVPSDINEAMKIVQGLPAGVSKSLVNYIEKLGEMVGDEDTFLEPPGCSSVGCLIDAMEKPVADALHKHLYAVMEEMEIVDEDQE